MSLLTDGGFGTSSLHPVIPVCTHSVCRVWRTLLLKSYELSQSPKHGGGNNVTGSPGHVSEVPVFQELDCEIQRCVLL